ncbi:hypothetical protein LMG33818_000180 [Halomonadaceae bacterium LMG 33818]
MATFVYVPVSHAAGVYSFPLAGKVRLRNGETLVGKQVPRSPPAKYSYTGKTLWNK